MGVFTPTTGAGVFATYTADPSDPVQMALLAAQLLVYDFCEFDKTSKKVKSENDHQVRLKMDRT